MSSLTLRLPVTRRCARLGRYCATATRKLFGPENLGACGLRSRRSQKKSRFLSFDFLRKKNDGPAPQQNPFCGTQRDMIFWRRGNTANPFLSDTAAVNGGAPYDQNDSVLLPYD